MIFTSGLSSLVKLERVPLRGELPARVRVVLGVVELHLQLAFLRVVLRAVVVVAGAGVERAIEAVLRVHVFEMVSKRSGVSGL